MARLSWLVYMKVTNENLLYATGRNIFNPLSYNFAIYITTGLLGSVAIAIAPSGQSINTMVDPQPSSVRIFGFLLMLYGAFIFILAVHFIRKTTSNYIDSRRIELKSANKSIIVVIFFILIAAILYYSYSRFDELTQVLFGGLDAWSILSLRASLAESEIDGFFIRRLIVEGMGWIFVLYLARTKRYKSIFYFMVFVISIYFLSSLTKIKSIMFIISIIMVMSWDARISIGTLIKYAIIIFIALIGIWAIFVGNTSLDYLFSLYSEGLVGRILISEISALYPHLSIFGNTENFLGFSSLSNLISTIFGETSSSRSARIVLEITSPEWVAAGIGGVYNTVFFGEAFANFGYMGLIFSPVWVVAYYGIVIWASNFLSVHLRVAFLTHTAINSSVMAGFNDFLWNPFLFVLFAILLFASRFKRYLRYVYRPTA
jgi:hypothetical protein